MTKSVFLGPGGGTVVISGKVVVKRIKVDISFFTASVSLSEDDLEEYARNLGLIIVDQHLLADLFKVDSTFFNEHLVGTHWKDGSGEWRYMIIGSSGKSMHDDCHNNGIWSPGCWFGGISPAEIHESVD